MTLSRTTQISPFDTHNVSSILFSSITIPPRATPLRKRSLSFYAGRTLLIPRLAFGSTDTGPTRIFMVGHGRACESCLRSIYLTNGELWIGGQHVP